MRHRNKGGSERPRVRRTLEWFERYRPLLDDPEAFFQALDAPPPADLLVPPRRISMEKAQALLSASGLRTEHFPFAPHHLRLPGVEHPGRLPEVVYGLAFPQGVVSGLAALALDVRPGQRVLDFCAAPGGKTAYLAHLGDDRVRIVANELKLQRTGILVQVLARNAVSSAVVTRANALAFPAIGPFHRILLDAPCTGEGTFRLPAPRYAPSGERGLERAAGVQRRLLRRAAELLAPGGRLVYATCTYAPEENECVLDAVLRERLDLEPRPLPGAWPGGEGVTAWRGRTLDSRLRLARRLLPHHTGSWGFFLAVLEKSGSTETGAATEPAGPSPLEDPDARRELAEFCSETFGVDPGALAQVQAHRRGRDLWIVARTDEDVRLDARGLEVVAPGLRALRGLPKGYRATNAFLRWLGPAVTCNRVELSWEDARRLLEQGSLPLDPGVRARQLALVSEGVVLGAGRVVDGRLHHDVPKAWR